MTEGTKGRWPARVALGLAVVWSVATVGWIVLALDWELSGWRGLLRFLWPVIGVVMAGFAWFRYVQERRKRRG